MSEKVFADVIIPTIERFGTCRTFSAAFSIRGQMMLLIALLSFGFVLIACTFLISAAKVRYKCAGFLRRKEKVSEMDFSETFYGEMIVCFHQSFLCFGFLVYVFFDLCTRVAA